MANQHDVPATLGAKIGAARKALGLSQVAISAQVGVSQNAWSRWESDDTVPGNVATMLAIIEATKKAPKALRLTLDDFAAAKSSRGAA